MAQSKPNDQLKQVATVAAIGAGAIAVGIGALYWTYRDHAWGSRRRTDLPNLEGAKPLLGNIGQFAAHIGDRLEWRYELFEKYGKIFYGTQPNRSIIFNYDMRDLAHVLSDPYNYIKGPLVKNSAEFLGHGIFASDAEEWRIQRKTAANIFTVQNFRNNFMAMFSDESVLLVEHIQNAAQQKAIVDLQDLLLRSTLDSFALLSMGKTVGAMKMRGEVHDGIYRMPNVEFMNAFDSLNEFTVRRNVKAFWPITDRLNGTYSKMQEWKKYLDDFAAEVVKEKRANKAAGRKVSNMRMDLLDFFMENSNEDGSPLSDEYFRDVVVNFILAGRDTTAQTLSWTFWRLAQNPKEFAKLRAEINQVWSGDVLTYDQLKDLKYCLAVFMESLRLHANVPTGRKQAVKDDVLPSGTKVYKGDFIEWSSWIMARETELWGADAHEWKPERWIDKNGSVIKPNQFQFPQFNAGPRICLGMNMAQQEGVVFLATIARKFDLELVKEDEKAKWAVWNEDPLLRKGRYDVAATLSMKGGVHFKVAEL
ncbi:hypothetical protein SmJEL517_g02535 [Synchytrium microbalum]|uniref:Cytochrome P450 n=1 Tax=Synchytrium microbalum TaxID=1806994 RepID=A0A507CA07_9FUNG|nr:uncharacterized protein SmJEL517_g02535 [Synchytrium microbalum]TPX34814.1 hypothetical protein SmJEL517_g02535 [Synchytrium microbalum]